MSEPIDLAQGLPNQELDDGVNPGVAAPGPDTLPDTSNRNVPPDQPNQATSPNQSSQAAAEKNATEASENVRWVEVNNVGGWPAMSKTLRDYDEEKVKDCKEDVDTLLVFAGLYSAVLSAFIIESYQNLQPDTKDEIVFLLRHMATQTYTFNSGFLNATTPIPDPPLFEPPQWAVRVNVLWFASLVFSLAAASLGMLVKQWLREFLAVEYTSPQQRLRARQYREPSLKTWKVYEIAAILPLFLQVALGLFFVGLCYFTAQIHSSVANTTLPLVCGWIFFFLMTTVAPLISPRCPFKTTLLKNVMKSARQHAFVLCLEVFIVIDESAVRHLISSRLCALRTHFTITFHPPVFLATVRKVFRALRIPLSIKLSDAQNDRLKKLLLPRLEEDEVLKDDKGDTEMLLAVDSVMSGNTLLSTILDAYQSQNLNDPVVTNRFILKLVSNRTLTPNSVDAKLEHIMSPPDLRSLTKQDWEALLDAAIKTPQDSLNSPPQWGSNVFMLLFSDSKHGLRQEDVKWLHRWISSGMLPRVLPRFSQDPARMTRLLIQIVQYFSGYKNPTGALNAPMRLRGLDKPAWESIALAATRIFTQVSGDIGNDSDPWIRHIVYLLLSYTPLHLPGPTKRALAATSFHSSSLESFLEGMPLEFDEVASVAYNSSLSISRVRRFLTNCIIDQPGVMEASGMMVDLTDVHPSIWGVVFNTAFKALKSFSHAADANVPLQSPPPWIREATSILLSKTQSQIPPDLLESLRQDADLGRLILRYGAGYLQERASASPARTQLLEASVEAFCSTSIQILPNLSDFEAGHWQSLTRHVADRLPKSVPLDPSDPGTLNRQIDVLLSRSRHALPDVAGEALTRTVMHSSQSIANLLNRHLDHPGRAFPHDLYWAINRLFEAEAASAKGRSQKALTSGDKEAKRDEMVSTWLPRLQELISNPPAFVYTITTLLMHLSSLGRRLAPSTSAMGSESTTVSILLCSQISTLLAGESWKRISEDLVRMLDQSIGDLSVSAPAPSWLLHSAMILLLSSPEEPLHRGAIRVVLQSAKNTGFYSLLGTNLTPHSFSLFNKRFFQFCGNPDALEGCLLLYTSALCQSHDHTHSSLFHFLNVHTQLDKDQTQIAENLFQLLLKCSQRFEFSWRGRWWFLSRQILLAISSLSIRFPALRDRAIEVFTEVFKNRGLAILLQLVTVDGNEDPRALDAELYIVAFTRSYKEDHRMLLLQLNSYLSASEVLEKDSTLHPLRLCATYIHIVQIVADGCVADDSPRSLFHDVDGSNSDADLQIRHMWEFIWAQLKLCVTRYRNPFPSHQEDIDRAIVSDAIERLRSLKDGVIKTTYPQTLEIALEQLAKQLSNSDQTAI